MLSTCRLNIQLGLQFARTQAVIALIVLTASACASKRDTVAIEQPNQARLQQSILVQTPAPATSQLLLNIRLDSRFDLPKALALDYSSQQGDSLKTAIGVLQRGLSGHYGDYPILLKVPAGSYRLRALRIAGISRNAQGALLARLNKSVDAVTSDTRYIGRLVLAYEKGAATSPSVSWQNHYDEDSLLARSSSSTLKQQKITNVSRGDAAENATTSKYGPQITIGVVGPDVLYALSDQQKPLFQRFLLARQPRAFAVGDFGAAGFATGSDAIELAMERCGRRGSKASCRILAIDNAVVLATSPGHTSPGHTNGQ